MNFVSVCTGIAAPEVAWIPLGWKPVFFAEIDKFPSLVLKHHHPDVPNAGDFTAIQKGDYDAIDALVAGTPCQDFSVAGLRAGMDGQRGQLTVEYAHLAHRLGPRWLVWENVPGVLSIDSGEAFSTFLGLLAGVTVKVPRGGWQNSGVIAGAPGSYGLAYRVLDAQYCGVPQRRRRVFVVGYLGDWRRAAAVLFERHSLSGHPAPRREARQVAPTIPSRSSAGGGLGTAFDCDGGVIVSALDASYGRLQGASGQDMNHGHSHLVAYGVNNTSGAIDVATAVRAKGGTGHGDFESETFVTHSLRGDGFDASEDGTVRGTPLVPVAIGFYGNDSGNDAAEECAPTLRSMSNGGGHCPAVAIQNALRGADQNGLGVSEDGVMYTLDQASQHAVAFSCKDHGADAGDTAPTLRAMVHDGSHANAGGQVAVMTLAIRGRGDSHDLEYREDGTANAILTPNGGRAGIGVGAVAIPAIGWSEELTASVDLAGTVQRGGEGGRHEGVMTPTMAVRRLTPRECERLQGFPDDYTKISENTADGPRYKALGNSMAVPVMRWIGERIQMVETIKAAA